jgi:hypothetical protein
LVALQLLLDFRTLLRRQCSLLLLSMSAANSFIGLRVSFLYSQIGMYFLSRFCQLTEGSMLLSRVPSGHQSL